MMNEAGIHAIIQKLQADAEEHSNERQTKIISDTDKEVEHENKLYTEELSKRRQMLEDHNKHMHDLLIDRMQSRFNHELLTYQRKLINEIFDMAAAKLINVSAEEFSAMFKAAVDGLSGDFTLLIGEYSKDKFDKRIISAAQKVNKGLFITLAPEYIPRKGGFLLRDARVEYDCLFEDLIENMKNEQAPLIIKEVFGDLIT